MSFWEPRDFRILSGRQLRLSDAMFGDRLDGRRLMLAGGTRWVAILKKNTFMGAETQTDLSTVTGDYCDPLISEFLSAAESQVAYNRLKDTDSEATHHHAVGTRRLILAPAILMRVCRQMASHFNDARTDWAPYTSTRTTILVMVAFTSDHIEHRSGTFAQMLQREYDDPLLTSCEKKLVGRTVGPRLGPWTHSPPLKK
ncbi:hypothetical protein J6590_020380 [Homalodisca vitripennis]|nr:hypothetical protein J6590_020380 [Homalodisca vitripennis]